LIVLLACAYCIGCGSSAGAGSATQDLPSESHCFPSSLEESEVASLNEGRSIAGSIVETGAQKVVLCRYFGLSQSKLSGTLANRHVIISRPIIASLSHQLNGLIPFPSGTQNCPADNGAAIYALFSYPGGPRSVVEIDLNGCRVVSNGVSGPWRLTARLRGRLIKLVPAMAKSSP